MILNRTSESIHRKQRQREKRKKMRKEEEEEENSIDTRDLEEDFEEDFEEEEEEQEQPREDGSEYLMDAAEYRHLRKMERNNQRQRRDEIDQKWRLKSMQRMEEDMVRDRQLMKIRQRTAQKRSDRQTNKKHKGKTRGGNTSNKGGGKGGGKVSPHREIEHNKLNTSRKTRPEQFILQKGKGGGLHPFLQSASNYSYHSSVAKRERKKAIRKKNSLSKEKHRAYGIMNQFSKEYAEGVTNNDLVVQSTLKEAEQWRRTIAEQEQREEREEREEREQEDYEEHEEQEQYPYHQQHHQLSPLSDSSDLGTSLLEYESRRLARLAPEIDSVLGYREEPQ